ncbi:TonB-dependent receptor [Croceicoccus bisphenolivorans]|uniref:TonB-dependent receptor n=1 Tax=Croceicoccus bisphenolivorans TaxID=1783232 RepID=UPI00083310BE|nr:TonB-dependent receptor [Croceicoccus bisphenolivorans]
MKYEYKLVSSLAAIACMTGTVAHADEIVVSGQRAQQIRAIDEKRDALGIVDVASADEIGRLPDRNVAEVIERLPGVGVQYDQGEGRYVAIRGIPSDLNGYTLNGFEIGNPDGGTRALPLDIISGQLLSRVEVTKVRTPDLSGQGIGGTVNLVPQTAFDFAEPFVLSGSAQVGFQQLNKDDHPVQADISVGGRFGDDEQFAILIGGSYSDRTFTSNGLYPDDWFPVEEAARGGMPTNIKYTDYSLSRERIGLSGSLDFRTGNTELYLRGFYSRFTEDEYRQRFRLDFSDGAVFDANGVTGISDDTEQRSDLRLEYKEKSVLTGMLGGETTFGDWTLAYGGARTHNEVIEPNEVWQFRGNPGDVTFDFTDLLYTVTPVNGPLEPADMGFRSYAVQDEFGEEDIWQFRSDLRYDGDWGFAKLGVNARLADKSFIDESLSYTRNAAPDRFTLDGLSGDNVTVYPDADHGYVIAPVIDADLIRAFTEANLSGPLFVQNGSQIGPDDADFSLEEDVYAAYAMADFAFSESVALTAGVRVEHTKLDITGYVDSDGTFVEVTDSNDYTDVLPTAILRIKPSDDVTVRLAYSRSVGRPAYSSLQPGGSFDAEDEILSVGNPNLKPYRAESLDMTFEYYFARGGLLSAGVFAKWIDNPIFGSSTEISDATFNGVTYDTLTVNQPANASSGEIVGLELAWQQQFTFLPGALSGLGAAANVTVTDGLLRVPGRDSTQFPEQSELLWGAQLFYQYGPVEASLAYHHTGRALIGVAGDPIDDQFNDNLRRLDAKISLAMGDHFTVFAQGQNLTDEPTRQYQGYNRDWVIQRERYGRVFWAGASFQW